MAARGGECSLRFTACPLLHQVWGLKPIGTSQLLLLMASTTVGLGRNTDAHFGPRLL